MAADRAPAGAAASRELALAVAREVDGMKARDVVILDVSGVARFTDYFVICTGETKRHLRAISKKLEEKARERKVRVHHAEGIEAARWILLDLSNVIVHIFDEETRDYYALERLWGDAPRVSPPAGANGK